MPVLSIHDSSACEYVTNGIVQVAGDSSSFIAEADDITRGTL